MQSHEQYFCDFAAIKTLVVTWNAGASTPYHLQHSKEDSDFMRNLLQGSNSPDILVFGFQELVDLEDKKTTASMSVVYKVLESVLTAFQKVFLNPRRKFNLSQST